MKSNGSPGRIISLKLPFGYPPGWMKILLIYDDWQPKTYFSLGNYKGLHLITVGKSCRVRRSLVLKYDMIETGECRSADVIITEENFALLILEMI